MAYVRVTELLITEVKNKIIAMAGEVVRSRPKPEEAKAGTLIFQQMQEAVLKSLWLKAPEARGTLPDEWLHKYTDVRATFDGPVSHRYSEHHLKFQQSPFYAPRDNSTYFSDRISVPVECMTDAIHDWLAAYEVYRQEVSDIQAQFKVVSDQVEVALTSYPSLNAALTEMPELEMYIPETFLAKVREKTAPRKKPAERPKAEDLKIDRDQLTSVAIAHRITTSANAANF